MVGGGWGGGWVGILTKYYQGDQIMTNEVGGACGIVGDNRGAYNILMGKNWNTCEK
jgi:hypothetical protein